MELGELTTEIPKQPANQHNPATPNGGESKTQQLKQAGISTPKTINTDTGFNKKDALKAVGVSQGEASRCEKLAAIE